MLWTHQTSRSISLSLSFSLRFIPLAHTLNRWLWLRLCTFNASIYLYLIANINQWLQYIIPAGYLVEPQFHLCCFHIYTQKRTRTRTHTHILHQIVDTLNSTCAAIIKLSIGGAFFRSYFTSSHIHFMLLFLVLSISPDRNLPSRPFAVVLAIGLFRIFFIHNESTNSIDDFEVNQLNNTKSMWSNFLYYLPNLFSLFDFLVFVCLCVRTHVLPPLVCVVVSVNGYSIRVLFSALTPFQNRPSEPYTHTLLYEWNVLCCSQIEFNVPIFQLNSI